MAQAFDQSGKICSLHFKAGIPIVLTGAKYSMTMITGLPPMSLLSESPQRMVMLRLVISLIPTGL